MTRRDTLQCVHEPFGDAYYFGPERLHERYEKDEKARQESGYADSTYKTIFDRIARDNSEVGSPCSISSTSPFFAFYRFLISLHPIKFVFNSHSLSFALIRPAPFTRVHLITLPHALTTDPWLIA